VSDAPAVPADDDGLEPRPLARALPRPLATWALIAANVAVFALEEWWGGSEWSPTLYRMGAVVGRSALAGEPWRVLASAFLHIGLVHLLANMWALYVFGHFLEVILGPWRLLVLYGAAALGGGLSSTLTHDQYLAAGASGAVWGLMVAELVVLLWPKVLFDDVVFNVSKWSVLQPLVLNLLISMAPGIDLMAHLGGGVAGGLIMASGVLARDPEARSWRPAAALSAAAMAACVSLAIAHGRPWELRAPVLEARPLPDAPVVIPVPPGQEMERHGGTVVFGGRPRDPVRIQCETDEAEGADAADVAGQLKALVRDARPSGSDVKDEEWPAIVQAGGRPAFHRAVRFGDGERHDLWYMIEDGTRLRLEVAMAPDAPDAWRSVPQRIAAGVAFTAPPVAATKPAPSSPPRPR
jgi:membrane associated rhomboid family serine protease